MTTQAEIAARAAHSVGDMLERRVRDTPDRTAFLVPDRRPEGPNEWTPVTWRDFRAEAHTVAAGLLSLGIELEQRVAIAATTRYEWIVADLAISCAGAAATTIYPNTTSPDVLHILKDSESRILIAENQAQVAKVQGLSELDDQLATIVIIDDDRTDEQRGGERVIAWADLHDRGEKYLAEHPDAVTDAIAATGPDTLSTLIYTSGTTGQPKGVELVHGCWTYQGAAMNEVGIVRLDSVHYLWLPLSHVFGKALIAVQLQAGFATAVDGRVDRIVQGLGEVRPTLMCGAPRIFEKVRNSVMTASPRDGVKGRITRWAFKVGRESRSYRLESRPMPPRLAAQYKVADRLVFQQLRNRMGGNIQLFISGSAQLSRQVQEWFYSAGITVIEGYGSTETSAIAFVNPGGRPRFGTVGPATPGMEAKIGDDGEVLLRGPIIARGYHNQPEATAESFRDGWFHTGDVGELDEDGFLTITDRLKDLIKTSGGKYVAPQKVEGAIAANIPYVSQAVALGEGRKYVVALLTLEPDSLMKWARKHNLEHLGYAELTQRPEIHASIERLMAKTNSHLERWETVKRFAILDHEFSVADGGVTPNMKVRRGVVEKTYAKLIDSLYDKDPSDGQ